MFTQYILLALTYGEACWATTNNNVETIRIPQKGMKRAKLSIIK